MMNKKTDKITVVVGALALLLAPAALFAQQADDSVLQWERIVGVIAAPNVVSRWHARNALDSISRRQLVS